MLEPSWKVCAQGAALARRTPDTLSGRLGLASACVRACRSSSVRLPAPLRRDRPCRLVTKGCWGSSLGRGLLPVRLPVLPDLHFGHSLTSRTRVCCRRELTA